MIFFARRGPPPNGALFPEFLWCSPPSAGLDWPLQSVKDPVAWSLKAAETERFRINSDRRKRLICPLADLNEARPATLKGDALDPSTRSPRWRLYVLVVTYLSAILNHDERRAATQRQQKMVSRHSRYDLIDAGRALPLLRIFRARRWRLSAVTNTSHEGR